MQPCPSALKPWRLALAMACLVPAQAARAATDSERLAALEQQLARSQSVIEQLTRRLAALEPSAPARTPATAVPASVATSTTPDAERRIDTLERQLAEVNSAMAAAKPVDDTGVPLHGFLDVGLVKHNTRASGGRSGAHLGTLDLYLTPQFGPKVRSLIELAFEYGEQGALATDLERMQIGYAASDALLLWGGRFHTPYGYWNTAFHHGAQMQTSITRPRFIAFEDQGGILPGHTVGAWATGQQDTAWGKLGYDAYVGNGNRINEGVLDFNASGDDNGSPLLGFNLKLSPRAVRGLTLGLHGLRQTVAGENADASASGRVRTQVLGGYAFYENDDWELIAEYYQFRNRNLAAGAGTLGSWAGFAQAAYAVAPGWALFGRAEKAALQATDPYFALQESGTSYRQWTAGLRYDLDPRAALKLQVDALRDGGRGNAPAQALRSLRAQYAIRF